MKMLFSCCSCPLFGNTKGGKKSRDLVQIQLLADVLVFMKVAYLLIKTVYFCNSPVFVVGYYKCGSLRITHILTSFLKLIYKYIYYGVLIGP